MKKIAIINFYTVHAAQLNWQKNISQQILNFDLNFRRSTFNWLFKKMSWRGASPHTFNLTWCLWCVIAETVAVYRRFTVTPLTRVQPAASVSPVCQRLVTTCLTKQEVKHRVEVRLMPACVPFVTWTGPAGGNAADWMFSGPMYKNCSMTGEQWGLQNLSEEGRI